MANPEHVAILQQGVAAWNQWRKEHPKGKPNLSDTQFLGEDLRHVDLNGTVLTGAAFSGCTLWRANFLGANLHNADFSRAKFRGSDLNSANLSGCNLAGADLRECDLSETNLTGANLTGADIRKADLYTARLLKASLTEALLNEASLVEANFSDAILEKADLSEADLTSAMFKKANLSGALLNRANLTQTNLTGADLTGANLERATLIETNLTNANLTGAHIYGISAWNLVLTGVRQSNLVVTPEEEPAITVDNLEIAQFVYLLLHNAKIRDVIDTVGKKAVLILGRFTAERKAVLDALRDELRQRDYIPILFDFEKPASRDLTETVMTLASLSRFVIADLSDPHSIPHELMSFAEKLLSVPVKPLFCPTKAHPRPYPMLEHLQRYPHVLPTYQYTTEKKLIAALATEVIAPAEAKATEMRPSGL